MGSEGEYDGLNWRRRRQVKERLQPRSLAWLTTPVSLGSHEGSKRREAPPLATQRWDVAQTGTNGGLKLEDADSAQRGDLEF